MKSVSLIYRHIWLYQGLMNILYGFGYKKRFEQVIRVIAHHKPKSVLELCFGDVFMARYCTSHHIQWQGIDTNEYFVRRAIAKGFDAHCADLLDSSGLDKAEMLIIIGSLYHFQKDIHSLLSRMVSASQKIIISEPINNLSDQTNWLGWIARKSTNAGNGEESFRYTNSSLLEMLAEESRTLHFTFHVVGYYKRDCLVLIERIQPLKG